MVLERANIRVRVKHASPKEMRWLSRYLSFPDKRFGARKTDGEPPRIPMLDELGGTFPAGFMALVAVAAANDGIPLEVTDLRIKPCEPDNAVDLEWLRHHPATDQMITHQIEAVLAVHQRERGIIWIPTGGGKTEVAIGIVKSLPCPWLFLVSDKSLLNQTAKRYEHRMGLRAGIVGDGEWNPANRFTVAMFQTLAAALKNGDPRAKRVLRHPGGIIVDESHTLPANTFLNVARAARNAYFRVGMSGTPLARTDRRSIMSIGALGPVVVRVSAQELIDKGVTAAPTIRMYACSQYGKSETYAGAYRELVVRSKPRNKLLVHIAKQSQKPALLFVQSIDHGKRIVKELRAAGLSSEFVWGKHGTSNREAVVKALNHHELDVAVCSRVFQQGVDIPELQSVIVGTGGKSDIATLQRLGRGGRATEGKDAFEVWDVLDVGNKWLARHARARKKAYQSEGYEVQLKTLTKVLRKKSD